MSDLLIAQLELQRFLKDQYCRGKGVDEETGEGCETAGVTSEQWDILPNISEIFVCDYCQMPRLGVVPAHLSDALETALGLDKRERSGATFTHWNMLSPYEWTCLEALREARDVDEDRQAEIRRQEAEEAARRRQ